MSCVDGRFSRDTNSPTPRENWVTTICGNPTYAPAKLSLRVLQASSDSAITPIGLGGRVCSTRLSTRCLLQANRIFLSAFAGQTKIGRGVGTDSTRRF